MRYTDTVLDHFYNPRNARRMPDATHVGLAGEPGKGSFMVVYAKADGVRVVEASFQTYGCAPAIACGSVLTEMVLGRRLGERISSAEVEEMLGGLPEGKRHAATLAVQAWEAVK